MQLHAGSVFLWEGFDEQEHSGPRLQVGLKAGTSGSGTRRVLSVPSPLSLFVAGVGGVGLVSAYHDRAVPGEHHPGVDPGG